MGHFGPVVCITCMSRQKSVNFSSFNSTGLSLNYTPNMEREFYCKSKVKRLYYQFRESKKGGTQKTNLNAKLKKLPAYQFKVMPEDFENPQDYERVHKDWELYDAKMQAEKHEEHLKKESMRKEKERQEEEGKVWHIGWRKKRKKENGAKEKGFCG